jgi:hypothetical protein
MPNELMPLCASDSAQFGAETQQSLDQRLILSFTKSLSMAVKYNFCPKVRKLYLVRYTPV